MGCAPSSTGGAPPPPPAAPRGGHHVAANPTRRGPGDPNNRTVKPSPPWAEPTPLTAQQLHMKREWGCVGLRTI